ncbi:MAG: sensor histidine kinase, partial [Flavobacteriales bacterium]
LGRTNEAAGALRSAEQVVEGHWDWNTRTAVLDLRYDLAVAEGQWREAVALLERIKRTSDSVLYARLDMQTVRLQMIYQLDRKEKANAELRVENAKSAERIAGTLFNNRVLVALTVILSGLTVALFLTGRYSRTLARRMRLKNAVIKRQHDEIHAKNLELQRQNLRLAETLMSEEEKEMMIKEIHHRVKNNLQVVDSLLQIQCMDSNEPSVGRVLREAQGRIRSMALVHEHIYNSANGNVGDLRSHMEKLVRNVLVAHGAHDRISVAVDTNLPAFSTDTLLPLTLVVNELFTNAVKYAFPDGCTGRVSIVVRPAGSGFELLFSDDGAGMTTADGPVRHRSFGLELIRQLADQLNGEVRFLKGSGTAVSLTFNPEQPALRVAS